MLSGMLVSLKIRMFLFINIAVVRKDILIGVTRIKKVVTEICKYTTGERIT